MEEKENTQKKSEDASEDKGRRSISVNRLKQTSKSNALRRSKNNGRTKTNHKDE